MEEFMQKVPYAQWSEFRKRAKEACGWSDDQWFARVNGRTVVTTAEKNLLNIVLSGMNIQ